MLNESIVVSAGSHLTIVAPESHFTQETAPLQKTFGYYWVGRPKEVVVDEIGVLGASYQKRTFLLGNFAIDT